MLDTNKAEREFGFRAKTSLEDGLKKTIEWYLKSQINQKDQKKPKRLKS